MTSAENMQLHQNDLDDRRFEDMRTPIGTQWRFVADTVMGGVSQGILGTDTHQHTACLRLSGKVSTANNGGFIQMALDIPPSALTHIDRFEGIELQIAGNGERYNLHLRTGDLWLPWQSFRSGFTAPPQWQTLRFPFSGFEPYRTGKRLKTSRLSRVAVVAIGRDFEADVCLANIRFYQSD